MYMHVWMEKNSYIIEKEIEREDLERKGLENIKIFDEKKENVIAILKNTERFDFDKKSPLWKIEGKGFNQELNYTEDEVRGLIKKVLPNKKKAKKMGM